MRVSLRFGANVLRNEGERDSMNDNREQFDRTTCACESCTACCKRQPGPLAHGDFERIAAFLGETHEQAKEHFWASPGALVQVGNRAGTEHQTIRVGTITPRFRKGRCVFLDENDRCKIHPVSPFGCSHFDTHMSNERALPRSLWLVRSQTDPEYQKLRDELPYATSYRPAPYQGFINPRTRYK
jgi:Fe-S-cluster containining protein